MPIYKYKYVYVAFLQFVAAIPVYGWSCVIYYIVLCIYTINTQRYYIYPLENLYIVPEVELYKGENVPEIRRKTCLLEKLNA